MKYLSPFFPVGFFALAVALASCSRVDVEVAEAQRVNAETAEFHAIVTYRERIAMPANAAIELWLSDETVADTLDAIIARRRLLADGKQVPISLALPYAPGKLRPGRDYTLRARVVTAGKTMFATPVGQPAIPGPDPVELTLERVSPKGKVNRPVENTVWRLVEIRGAPAERVDDRAAPTIRLDPVRREVQGSGGCGSFGGSYEVRNGSVSFGPLTTTRHHCPDPAAEKREDAVLELFEAVRGWRVSGDTLVLSGGGKVARFAADR